MASGALFGNTVARSSSSNLVEFRAGKMYMKGDMVHPDKRKGMVYLHQSDDSLIHFCWKDRTSGSVEDDLIIFPDDCEFKHVKLCTTGRVFVLKFKNTNRKLFFWMQEPKSDLDSEQCKKMNEFMNNPPAPGLTPELLEPLLSRADVREQLQHLLPDTSGTSGRATGVGGGSSASGSGEELLASTLSPQFQQSLALFSAALQSGQLGPLMAQFGYGAAVVEAANAGDMERVLRAIQEAHGRQEGPGQPPAADDAKGTTPTAADDKKKDKDDDLDDGMELD